MLKLDAKNPKALFRYGEALIGSKDYDEAKKQFEAALEVAPNDKGNVCLLWPHLINPMLNHALFLQR